MFTIKIYIAVAFGLFNLAKISESVIGCVTIIIAAESKQCICNNLLTKFTRIPSKLPKFIVKLEVKNQNIYSLTSDQLIQVELLEDLNLDTNKLSSIDNDAFINVPKLLHLSMKNNLLILGGNSFPSAALLQLKNLKTLNLENNPLGHVPDFFFQSLKNLQKLVMSKAPNGFYLEPNSLVGLTSLESLDLSMSYLSSLEKPIQSALNNMQLVELFLYGNRWKCDCNLKWLKKWWMKYKYVKISKKFKRANGEIGIAQPHCFTPHRFTGHNIFEIIPEYENIKLNNLYCPPKIFTKNQQLQIDQGKNLTLMCEFEADPGGSIEWSKNGMVVQRHWKRIRWGQTIGMRFTAWLSITKTEIEDNGLWRCILITELERVNATFSVRVKHYFSSVIDLTIIFKYIGIGAITLILLLVIIGISIYCVYGFKIRPFHNQTKSSNTHQTERSTRTSFHDGESHYSDNNSIRPLMVNSLIYKEKRKTEEDLYKYTNNNDTRKSLLISSSPSLVIPIKNRSIINNSCPFPCPLHGNINFIDHSSLSNSKQTSLEYGSTVDIIQPHTLPRKNSRIIQKMKENHLFIQSSKQQMSNNCTSCPLHGNMLMSFQRQNDNDNDNMNSIYSTFFSPRHSQPFIDNLKLGSDRSSSVFFSNSQLLFNPNQTRNVFKMSDNGSSAVSHNFYNGEIPNVLIPQKPYENGDNTSV